MFGILCYFLGGSMSNLQKTRWQNPRRLRRAKGSRLGLRSATTKGLVRYSSTVVHTTFVDTLSHEFQVGSMTDGYSYQPHPCWGSWVEIFHDFFLKGKRVSPRIVADFAAATKANKLSTTWCYAAIGVRRLSTISRTWGSDSTLRI